MEACKNELNSTGSCLNILDTLESGLSMDNIRHGLVDGLHAIAHGKLIYYFLWSLLEVNLPCIIPFGIRDLHYTIVLDIGHIVEEVLRKNKTGVSERGDEGEGEKICGEVKIQNNSLRLVN